jgi:alanine-alpha-ketoisovalerate/valine-pyruvate aminotransferase
MKRKTALLVTEDDLLVDMAYHNVPPSLLIEFSEKIVRPYYRGDLTTAIKDLLEKAISEQDIVLSHIKQQR